MNQYRDGIRRFMEFARIESVAEFARRSGVHFNTINKFLKGETQDIELGTLAKMADNLGITVGTLIGEIGFRDSARQDYEGTPDQLKSMLRPEQIELLESAEGLSLDDLKTGSRMLKGLPREGEDGKAQKRKENKKNKR